MEENKINYDRDILLARDKENDKLRVVTGIDENGKMKIVVPSMKMKNEKRFLTVDHHSDELKNFFDIFLARSKNTLDTEFYKMRVNGLERGVEILQGFLTCFRHLTFLFL